MTNSKRSPKTAPLIKKAKGSNGNGKPKILLIDEIPDNHITVQAILGDGYDFIGVSGGYEGIDSAKMHKPDLILLDISLPGVNGYNVFQTIRYESNTKQTPIIAFTAKAMKGDKEELLAFGFDDYISKPIDEQLFHRTLNKWLNGE